MRDSASEGGDFAVFDDVLSWRAYPTETIERASTVSTIDGRRYAIEPIDCPGLDDHLEDTWHIDGVIVLMDRHTRDSTSVATRFDVDVFAPASMERIDAKLTAPVRPLASILEGSEYEAITLVNRRFWQEMALWRASDGTLIVPESLGTAAYFRIGSEEVGVHPIRRVWPPRSTLGSLHPRRLFTGHGYPVDEVDIEAFHESIHAARRRLPRAWFEGLIEWIRPGSSP